MSYPFSNDSIVALILKNQSKIMVTHSVLRTIPVGQVLRHARATDVINVHVTLDRDVLVLAVKTPVKTTAFIMRYGDTLAFLSLSNKSIVFIPGLLCSRFEIYLKFHRQGRQGKFQCITLIFAYYN